MVDISKDKTAFKRVEYTLEATQKTTKTVKKFFGLRTVNVTVTKKKSIPLTKEQFYIIEAVGSIQHRDWTFRAHKWYPGIAAWVDEALKTKEDSSNAE